jgi:actin-related protein
MLLALPIAFPLPLVSTILDTLFTNFQPPNISLLSAAALTTVAAGLRSALIVDVGWAETVVTAIYEYREVGCRRSTRGSKMLGEEFFKMIANSLGVAIDNSDQAQSQVTLNALPSFAECEDIIARVAWCNPGVRHPAQEQRGRELTPVNEEDELRASTRSLNINNDSGPNPTLSILLSSTKPPKTLAIPFSDLAEPCEKVLLGKGQPLDTIDDEELPLHFIIYHALLQLPVDVRSICMSRIIFVGGGSKINGLKSRLLNDVASLIEERGWDRVQGNAYDEYRLKPKIGKTKSNQLGPAALSQNRGISQTTTPTISASLLEQEDDPIEEQLRREAAKRLPSVESGNIRAVHSLGAWAGGSLVSQLRISAVSVVDRDQWLLHGAAGASRGSEGAVGGSRQSLGSTGTFNKPGAAAERNSWTLGLWA